MRIYRLLLYAYPRDFRRRFGDEMEQAVRDLWSAARTQGPLGYLRFARRICADWLITSVRESFSPTHATPAPVPAGVPTFATCESSTPRSVLIPGAVLTLASFAGVTYVLAHSQSHAGYLIGTYYPRTPVIGVDRDSLASAKPNTLVRIKDPDDPWEEFATFYFRLMPVLGALDTNHDRILSRSEIDNAPKSLLRLDKNHDGRLDPEEYGLSPRALRYHPVLAALDRDHDGVISADEIRNSPASLRTLDANHDGRLTAAEIAPGVDRVPPPPYIHALMLQFESSDIVALGDRPGTREDSDLRIQLVRHPDFPNTVRYIVVECANASHQDALDRYIGGEDVPQQQLQKVWRDVTTPGACDSPVYEQFLDEVRTRNQYLPDARKLRVLAGDPPIDWARIHSREDWRRTPR